MKTMFSSLPDNIKFEDNTHIRPKAFIIKRVAVKVQASRQTFK